METISREFHAPTTTKLNTQFIATTAISVSVNQMKNTLTPDRNKEPAEKKNHTKNEAIYLYSMSSV